MSFGALLSKKAFLTAALAKTAAPVPKSPPPPSILGVYKVKDDKRLTFTRYGIHFDYEPGFEVEVIHERGEQVLVNFVPGLTVYVDTKLFLDSCTR